MSGDQNLNCQKGRIPKAKYGANSKEKLKGDLQPINFSAQDTSQNAVISSCGEGLSS